MAGRCHLIRSSSGPVVGGRVGEPSQESEEIGVIEGRAEALGGEAAAHAGVLAEQVKRQVERSANKRDLAVLQVLRHPGMRVGELVALCLSDVMLSEREGQLVVRAGKGT